VLEGSPLSSLNQTLCVILMIAGIRGAIWGLHYLYFIYLPQRAIKRFMKANPEYLRRYLERVVATPSLFGPGIKLVVHMQLVGIYFSTGQHAKAIAHCRADLDILSKFPGINGNNVLEAALRRQLADCLEALGEIEEAEEERCRAAHRLNRAPADSLRHLTQGALLQRQNRHEEAYAEFQRGLEITPVSEAATRLECLNHLMLAADSSGRPLDCLHWAEESIAFGATGADLRTAHRMAGLACGYLSQLDQCERHHRNAYEVSAIDQDLPAMAETLCILADCLRRRGKLDEAYAACMRAMDLDPNAERMSLAVQTMIFRERGRYQDALAILMRYADTNPLVVPYFEKRTQAARALDSARVLAEDGRGDEAWNQLQSALAVFRNDERLGLKCEAARAWVLAARGLADESKLLAVELEPGLAAFERDPSTCRGALYDLGMAANSRNDNHAGIDCWTRYLALRPDPVYQPTAYYHRGECHRLLGQLAEAKNDYAAAVAMQLETHYTGLARWRLSGFTST
jgi:tetratricopeptide (TPR) repeat protein